MRFKSSVEVVLWKLECFWAHLLMVSRELLVLTLVVLLALALCGCGRRWEQLWGQDTRREPRYIELVPDQLWDDVRGRDVVQFLDTRLVRARYLSVKVCDTESVCLPLPQSFDGAPLSQHATYLLDKGLIPGLLSVFNLSKLPGAERVVVEFVL